MGVGCRVPPVVVWLFGCLVVWLLWWLFTLGVKRFVVVVVVVHRCVRSEQVSQCNDSVNTMYMTTCPARQAGKTLKHQ